MIKKVSTRIPTGDGIEVAVTAYQAGPVERAALILPATGATQDRYEAFARFLASEGWYAITFDYRGIGRSAVRAAAREQVSMQAWGEQDLAAVIDWVTQHARPEHLVAVGHSIGGQIIPLAANSARIDAVLAVAAQKGHWRLWDVPNKYLVYGFFRYYIPLCLRLFGHVPLAWAGLHHLEGNAARDYARWTLRLGYADATGECLMPRFAEFRAPILALSFADDTKYAPRRAVDFLMRHYYLQAPVWRCHVEPKALAAPALGHSGFFEPSQCPLTIWQEVSDWLHHAAAKRPLQDYAFSVLRQTWSLTDKRPLHSPSHGIPLDASRLPEAIG